ncbi:hypothetical protein DLD77_02035 [Chitinophaga alhagiae]|uniref:DUF4843 domain-containing protein n=2 Tax=Chitinophaga alhagiae TaxID=2203219 RepID=A0ABN5LWM6_9BACT|nr:DUF4843 domain-containing protein [Chitinophaga alhagiae]AWO00567.1 hypothetical protein DLD77_02035 [Chitinophaga alhagiae]
MKMKTIYQPYLTGSMMTFCLAAALLLFSGCFKKYEEDFFFRDLQVEFDAATWQNKAPGKTYPLMPVVNRASGTYHYKVNLVGGQVATAQNIGYRIVPEETTAQEGVHFRLLQGGAMPMQAAVSIDSIGVEILDFPPASGELMLVLELTGNESVKASENYKRIGIPINRRGIVVPGELYPGLPLYEQLGGDNYYNTITLDPLYPGLPPDLLTRWNSAAQQVLDYGGRILQSFSLRFTTDQTVEAIAWYYSGSGKAQAIWTYKFEADASGKGRFVFVSGNTNANNLRSRMQPLLEDYLEQYEFNVDWIDPAIIPAPAKGYIGGIFRADEPASFIFGPISSIETVSADAWPLPSSPAIEQLFGRQGAPRYTSILIDPAEAGQSEDFKTRWETSKTAVLQIGGRRIHKMLVSFDADFNGVKVLIYYFTSTNGKVLARYDYQARIDHNGIVKLAFLTQTANGNAIRPGVGPLIDEYFNTQAFSITKAAGAETLTLTQVSNNASFFSGTPGNHPISAAEFFPE